MKFRCLADWGALGACDSSLGARGVRREPDRGRPRTLVGVSGALSIAVRRALGGSPSSGLLHDGVRCTRSYEKEG
jgi:hypothetical protein